VHKHSLTGTSPVKQTIHPPARKSPKSNSHTCAKSQPLWQNHNQPVQYLKSPGLKSDILGGNYPCNHGNLPLHRISCAVTLDYNTTTAKPLQAFFYKMTINLAVFIIFSQCYIFIIILF